MQIWLALDAGAPVGFVPIVGAVGSPSVKMARRAPNEGVFSPDTPSWRLTRTWFAGDAGERLPLRLRLTGGGDPAVVVACRSGG